MSEEAQKEIEDKTTEDEIQRLKMLEVQNNTIQQQLSQALQKNQINDQIFQRISAFLDEILKTTARTTYLATMAKDIVDNRNATSS